MGTITRRGSGEARAVVGDRSDRSDRSDGIRGRADNQSMREEEAGSVGSAGAHGAGLGLDREVAEVEVLEIR